jgi:glycine/D-amino acid oxidase-like deaminating enzyme
MPGGEDSARNTETKDHTVVIGGSIAGLCAARVLSDFYTRVTVYERDELPATAGSRAAVPQDRHLHMLMARGRRNSRACSPGC